MSWLGKKKIDNWGVPLTVFQWKKNLIIANCLGKIIWNLKVGRYYMLFMVLRKMTENQSL